MASKAQKLADARINRIYSHACSGVQIDIMDISKVFQHGYKAISAGANDAELETMLVAFVETIRRN